MVKEQVLILTSVASMIDQFIMPNIKLLIKMGYQVHVACNFKEGSTCPEKQIKLLENKLLELNVLYHQIDFKRDVTRLLDNKKAYIQVHDLMKKNKFVFVHCHSPIGGVCGRLAGKSTNTKVIYTAHGFHFYKGAPLKNWILYYPIEKWLSKYTDCLITINEEDYNTAIKKHFKANNIKWVHGVGIDLCNFKPQVSEEKSQIRKEYGYNEDEFILLYVAELSYRKHQDLLINVARILKSKIPNFKVLLVGTGSLFEQYKKLIIEFNVDNQVELLGYRNDICNLMLLSDVAISTSRQEGLPVNVMEAMATGLPLVVSDIRGNSDLVKNEENGYVVSLDASEEFSALIERLYNDVKLRGKFGRKSLELVQKYSLENVLLEMELIYKMY